MTERSGQTESEETTLRRAVAGDSAAWVEIMATYRPRLRRVIAARLDHRLSGLVDPSDVLQEAFADLPRRLPEYLRDGKVPFFVWLRGLAADKMARVHRHHLATEARDAGRTLHSGHSRMPDASSVALCSLLLDGRPEPGDIVVRAERRQRVIDALGGLDPDDLEALVLRHFEGLTAAEAAAVQEISEAAARKRYLRALERFTGLLRNLPGGLEGFMS